MKVGDLWIDEKRKTDSVFHFLSSRGGR